MDYIFIVIVGLCIGSFLNVCIYRIPNEQSIAFPASHCFNCNYKLKWKDLIPVFSYVILKGKCRNCGDKISIQYPLIELINGILYLCIYIQYGYSIDTVKYMILTSIMIVISIIDLKTMYVYLSTIIFSASIGVVFLIIEWVQNGKIPLDKIIGAGIGLIIIGVIVLLTGGMGEGDIEVAAVSGLFLGIKGITFMLFTSFIIGGIVAGILLFTKKKKGKSEIAFGPYLGVATIISIFVGNNLVELYLNLL
ncbi:MAG: prepilin peptidase [Clostridiales bacterium]|nr:prepilin peptidase [Clostridiales bacterium]